jgi:predicted phage terminase large subunit-like protein
VVKLVPRVPPRATQAVRYWDKAASEGAGDYSAGVLIVPFEGVWYIADVIRGRWSPRQRNQIMRTTTENDSVRFAELTTVIEQEPGSGGKESAEYSRRLLAGYHVQIDKVTGAKDIRAQPLADQCEGGNVFVVKADWNMRFIEELCVFPAGDHDDQLDAAAGAFQHSCRTPAPVGSASITTPAATGCWLISARAGTTARPAIDRSGGPIEWVLCHTSVFPAGAGPP